jgi:carnosine N-methyltransferase
MPSKQTVHNSFTALHVLCRVLRPGGYWLHMGPLLWHWADGSWEELSIELSLADVQQAALLMGFKLISQEFVDAAYIGENALFRQLCHSYETLAS